MNDAQREELALRFQYHPPTSEATREAHESVRSRMREAAEAVVPQLPDGAIREQALFLAKVEEAMFWANAAIARHRGSEGGQDGAPDNT